MTALAMPHVTLRCKTCGNETCAYGTSAWHDAPEGWLVDQFSYYNPNGLHYCVNCARLYWVAYCDDPECEGCTAGGDSTGWSGVLVAALPQITGSGVLDSLHHIDARCPKNRPIFDVEEVPPRYVELKPHDAAIDLCL